MRLRNLAPLSLVALWALSGCSDTEGDSNIGDIAIPPSVRIEASPTAGASPLEVTFKAELLSGTEPVIFGWDFGDGSVPVQGQEVTHTFGEAGEFTVTLVAGNSAGEDTDEVEIRVAQPLMVTATADPEEGRNPLEINFDATITGGVEPFEIGWEFGDGGVSSDEDPAYTYQNSGAFKATVTVTDAAGLEASAELEINVAQNDEPFATIVADPATGVAPLDVSFEANVTGGDGALTFAWDFGDGDTSDQENPSHSYSEPGTFAVTLTVSDEDGDESIAATEVVVLEDLTPTLEISGSPLAGVEPLEVAFEATVQGGNEPVAITWNFGDESTSILEDPTHTFTQAGTFTVTATAIDDDGDEVTQTLEVVVEGDLEPEVEATVDPAEGVAPLSVTLGCQVSEGTGNAPFEFRWDLGDGQRSELQNPTHVYTQAGQYTATCTVTDADGDEVAAQVSINVATDLVPEVVIQADPASGLAPLQVAFEATVLGGDAPFEFEWDFAGLGQSEEQQPGFTFEEPGSYLVTVTVTDADGDTASAALDIPVGTDDAPIVEITADPAEGIAPLEVTFNSEIAGGNEPVEIEWDFGDGNSSIQQDPTHIFTQPGTFTVTATVTDDDGDTSTDTLEIVVDADLEPQITATADVQEGIAPLTVAFNCDVAEGTGNAPFEFAWNFGNGVTSTLASPTFTYTEAGTFTATCTVTDADGDEVTAEAGVIEVEEDLEPEVEIVANPLAGVAPLEVSFEANATGGNGPLTFAWNFGDGTTSDEQNPTHTFTEVGTFEATVTVTDRNDDVDVERVQISVGSNQIPAVEITAGPEAGPAPLTVIFSCSVTEGTGNAPFEFAWNFGDGNTSELRNPIHTYTEIGNFTATCTVTDRFGQEGQGTISIDAQDPNQPPVIDALTVNNGVEGAEQTCAAIGRTVMNLEVVATDPNEDALDFEWSFTSVPQGASPEFTSPTARNTSFAVPLQAGDYEILVRVRDGRGGVVSQSVTITAQGPGALAINSPVDPAPGDAGLPYPETFEAAVSTECGLPFVGMPVRWEATGATVGEVIEPGDESNRTQATVIMGCDPAVDAVVTANVGEISQSVTIDVEVGPASDVFYQAETNIQITDADGNLQPMTVFFEAADVCGNVVEDEAVEGLNVELFGRACFGNEACGRGSVTSIEGFSFTGEGTLTVTPDDIGPVDIIVSAPEGINAVGVAFDPFFDIDRVIPNLAADSPEWQIGAPVSGAASGIDAVSTVLGGNYAPSQEEGLETRSLLLTMPLPCVQDGDEVRLFFRQNIDIAPGAVGVVLVNEQVAVPFGDVTYNGQIDVEGAPIVGFQGNSGGFQDVQIDLTELSCQLEEVEVVFTLALNNAEVTGEGWTIDDIAPLIISDRATGRFLPGEPFEVLLGQANQGIAACELSPATLDVLAFDARGNPAIGELRLTSNNETPVTFEGVGGTRLLDTDAEAGEAVIRLLTGEAQLNVGHGAPSLTVGAEASVVDEATLNFIGQLEVEDEGRGTCNDGLDNDCDGLLDCEDDDCNNNIACGFDMAWAESQAFLEGNNLTALGLYGNVGFQDVNACVQLGAVAVPAGDPAPTFPFFEGVFFLEEFGDFICQDYPQGDLFPFEQSVPLFDLGLEPGDYDIYLTVVINDEIIEFNTSNNASEPMFVTIPEQAVDLVGTVNDAFVTFEEGVRLDVTYEIANQGSIPFFGEGIEYGIHLTARGEAPNENTLIQLDVAEVAQLEPGQNFSDIDISFLPLLPPGSYDVYLEVDIFGVIEEGDENNNLSAPFPLEIGGNQLLPDLTTNLVDVTNEGVVQGSLEIFNDGDVPVPGPEISVAFFLTPDPETPPQGEPISVQPANIGEFLEPGGFLEIPFVIDQNLPDGMFLWALVDFFDDVEELDENNNLSFPQMLTPPPQQPDLIVELLQLDINEVTTLFYTVTNIGQNFLEQEAVDLGIFVSDVPDQLNPEDLIGTTEINLILAPGQSETFATTMPAPEPGQFVFGFIDIQDEVVESDEGNNISQALQVTDPNAELPDLQTFVSDYTIDGQSSTITVDVQNQGNALLPAQDVEVAIFARPDAALPNNNDLLGTVTLALPDLDVGFQTSFELPLEGVLPDGTFLRALIDSADTVEESNEFNNLSPGFVIVPPAQLPDLQVSILDVIEGLATVDFINSGNQAFNGDVAVAWFVTEGPEPPDPFADDPVDLSIIGLDLLAGDSLTLSLTAPEVQGPAFLWAFVDATEEVEEADENNNVSNSFFIEGPPVGNPELSIILDNVIDNTVFTVVTNGGNAPATGLLTLGVFVTDAPEPPNPIFDEPLTVAQQEVDIAAGDTLTIDPQAELPETGFVWVFVDLFDEFDELNEEDNLSGSFELVAPPQGIQPGDMVVTEFMPNPAAVPDSNGEWFEMHNTTNRTLNLNGCVVSDNAANSAITEDVFVEPGGFALFAINGNPLENGGLPAVDVVYNGLALANGGDIITLTCEGAQIDTVDYGSNFPYAAGVSAQLACDFFNDADNDNVANWLEGTVVYGGGDQGTPGANNDGCGQGGNQPPLVEPIEDQFGAVQGEAFLQVIATDPEGDLLNFDGQNLPPGLFIDADTGLISGIIEDAAGSPFAVTITVDDNQGNVVELSFVWTVEGGNQNLQPFTTAELQARFDAECNFCHGANFPSGGVTLLDFEANTIGQTGNAGITLLTPGDPQSSYLWHKIAGTQADVGGFGSTMPQGGPFWSADDVERMRLYILDL